MKRPLPTTNHHRIGQKHCLCRFFIRIIPLNKMGAGVRPVVVGELLRAKVLVWWQKQRSNYRCPDCGSAADRFGLHAVTCQRSGYISEGGLKMQIRRTEKTNAKKCKKSDLQGKKGVRETKGRSKWFKIFFLPAPSAPVQAFLFNYAAKNAKWPKMQNKYNAFAYIAPTLHHERPQRSARYLASFVRHHIARSDSVVQGAEKPRVVQSGWIELPSVH